MHKQQDLEQEMVDLGKTRYHSKVNKAREMGIESTTPVGQKLLGEAVSKLSDAIAAWLKEAATKSGPRHRAYEGLSMLPPKVSAALSAKAIIDSLSMHKRITSTAYSISRYLLDEVKFKYIQENEPALWKHIQRVAGYQKSYQNKSKFIKRTAKDTKLQLPDWNRKDSISIGIVCIELLRQATGIIEIQTRSDNRGKYSTFIVATDDLKNWIKEAHKDGELMKPVYMPMVTTPLDWSSPTSGGYITNLFFKSPLVKTTDKTYQEELENVAMPKVYRALNAIQRTPYSINNELVKVMRYFWDSGVSVGGLPTTTDEAIPTKPVDIETNEVARRAWRKQAARTHFENERQASKRLQCAKVLYLADKFKDETIFFPRKLDFRGREYPIPYFLTPQGPDWSQSALQFKNGKTIDTEEAENFVAINLANLWGEDKKCYYDRVQWTWTNDEWLQAIGNDPLEDLSWGNADKPYQFLAAAQDWARYRKQGHNYVSHLPIGQDASTQGLQIYAMLLGDEIAARATNVLPSDYPSDTYQMVADRVIQKLKEDNTNEYANKWLAFGIDRKTTKRQTMVIVYGSKYYSCKQYTAEWFYEKIKTKENPFGEETYRPCNYLSELIWQSINEVVSSARIGMDWFQEIASICMEHNVPIRWTTPLGFLVKMDYQKMDKYTVRTSVGQVIRQHRIRTPNGELNRQKNKNAIAPNVVHSLDGLGGLLGQTVNLALNTGIENFWTVHDHYATLAADAPTMFNCIREATVDLFSENILQNFRDSMMTLLPSSVELPLVPERGNLEISKVLNSDYYFN